jgi:hypothetical protein
MVMVHQERILDNKIYTKFTICLLWLFAGACASLPSQELIDAQLEHAVKAAHVRYDEGLVPAASDSNKVEASFRTFCQKRLVSLRDSKNRNVQCAKRKDAFIAEYSRCSKDYSITVKEGNPKDSSYVGILKYKQEKFKSSGMTSDSAKNGTFQRTGGVPVTELFLYRNGRWQQ